LAGKGKEPLRPSAQSTIVEAPAARRAADSAVTGAATPSKDDDPPPPVPVGSVLDARYRLLELIGQGGMGAVYRARDLTLDAEVAVKILDRAVASDPKLVDYFRNEVKTARKVTHPNVCRLHDLVEADGLWCITMQYVEGSSLADRMREGGGVIPIPEAMRILRDVAAGLAAAHEAGVVHRDLKPANILLAAGDARAIVADFGIAAEVNRLGVATMDVAGTRGYMSPEQAAGRPVDARTDVYAFGVLAHRMLTGEVPATAPARVGATDVGGPEAALPDETPPGLITLIDQCLSGDPATRPAGGSALVARLDRLSARRDPTPRLVEIEAPAPRRRARVVLIAALLAGLAAVAIWRPWRAAPAAAGPGATEIVLDRLSLDDPALADSVLRLTIDELDDAWGMPARVAGGPPPGPRSARARGQLFVDRDHHLLLELELTRPGGASVEKRFTASGPRPLAAEVARWLVEASVPPAERRPTGADLAAVCARSPEAWRLWRRAQRESRMQRWGVVRELTGRAIELDPSFAIAHVELAFSYMRGDEALGKSFEKGLDARCSTLSREWKIALHVAEVVWMKDVDQARRMVEEVTRDPATSARDKLYFETRWALSQFFGGYKSEGVARLEWIAESWPSDPAAPKLLANHLLTTDDPASIASARGFAERALETAPYDLAVRADLARILLLAGDRDGALAHARIIERADPREKQAALAGNEADNSLAALNLEIGDLAAAERDARRLLLGSPTEVVQGNLALGALELLRGGFAAGVDRIGAAADVAGTTGVDTVAVSTRWRAAWAAYHAGDLARARAHLEKITHPYWRERAKVLEALVDHRAAPPMERGHHLAHARAAVKEMRREWGPVRIAMEQLVAHERGDWAQVLALDDDIRSVSRAPSLASLYFVASARAGRGELAEAAAGFQRLAVHPQVWKEPVLGGRAWRRLGEVREALGDRAAAAAAYRTLLERWPQAPVADPDLAVARGAAQRLDGSVDGSRPPW
jgi:tetratricopeptide (TPR) repeat protein